ncbi:alpha/beta-hydrolase [Dothidotthia symphoricarpi CBS 119687]|uniref:Alpha/beta-hydrolase n=1 Tax=Dothidotthia symphoricarpi CBS 119687 TaxID=1392245 RepID=A0A6A6A2N6_9PLEO|nr:alpha/beta-hydrolase [Dothidotthia symphoricarpi CBS 119687]KAF2125806.1 alpha/beta-hydrolase [Dothidotthia symphoricarpi CBS 119687]
MIADLAWWVFKTSFGLISLASIWVRASMHSGPPWAKDTEQEKKALGEAQDARWSLIREPIAGFRHAFYRTRKGARLHYVVNRGVEEKSEGRNVAIFIHGFPDSYLLWRSVLEDPELRDYVLVAVDLPGYGGSDGLSSYDATSVLEALTDFIIGMRSAFLNQDYKLVMVMHDWGSLIGARLASEAKGLADHWVVTSGLVPHATVANVRSQSSLAMQMLRTWTRQPLNTVLLRNAIRALDPVKSQFSCSFYIFCFNLPPPFNIFFATFGNYWFLRILHSLGKGKAQKPDAGELAEAMAMSAGPAMAQITKNTGNGHDGLRYGEAVRKRVADRGMAEKIRIYREGLFVGTWDKSLQTTADLYNLPGSSVMVSTTAPQGAFKAPATIIMGKDDLAFDRRLALGGVRDYLPKGSHVLVIEGAGHWLPIEETGRLVLQKTVRWALGDGTGKSAPFADMSNVQIVEEL